MKRSILLIVTLAGLALGSQLLFRSFPFSVLKNTTIPKQQEVLFGVIGDTEGHSDVFERALVEAKRRGAAFMIHTGDITENGDEADFSKFKEVADRVGLPVYAAIGNHDVRAEDSADLFERYFGAADRAVDAGGFRLLILNNENRKVGFSESTLAFMTDEFAAHKDASYIVVFHRPFALPFSALIGDDETPSSRPTNERFLTLIQDKKVLAYFSGHLHLYLPYRLGNVSMYVTGGGGADPQSGFSALAPSSPHFLLARVEKDAITTEYVPLD